MRIKVITETQVLVDEEYSTSISEASLKKLGELENRTAISYLLEFAEGTKMHQTRTFEEAVKNPNLIKQITIKLR